MGKVQQAHLYPSAQNGGKSGRQVDGHRELREIRGLERLAGGPGRPPAPLPRGAGGGGAEGGGPERSGGEVA
jgi:hypothetical protein